jgi:(R,R)-butanediol dehydrogenase / meso-butanediol dehydrogenase / diacetyl reductase
MRVEYTAMRAALYYGQRDLRIESAPEPDAGVGEVKLRVRFNGICGSDLHEYYDGPITTRTTPHPLTGVKNPVVMGHELCGEVVAVGEGVEDLTLGGLVSVDPLESCGACVWCQAGQYPHCPTVALHGYNRSSGGLAEYCVVRREMAHPLPLGVTARQGALIEPLAVAWNTANRCRLESGQIAAVYGAGPIGIGVTLTLKRRGVDVIAIDPSPERRRIIGKLGARWTLDPKEDAIAAVRDLTAGRGAHASVDAAGAPSAFRSALLGTRVDGTMVVVAIHHQPLVIPPFDMLMPEVYITGVAMSAHAFPSVIAEMARGSYPLDEWVETIPFDRLMDRGFERLRRQEGIKILVDIAGNS